MKTKEKIERLTDKSGSCWDWLGTITNGTPRMQNNHIRYNVLRYVFTKYVTSLSVNEFVYRTCGNRKCIKPSHLKAGSRADITAHLRSIGALKMTAQKAFNNTIRARKQHSKLTPEQALEIFHSPLNSKELAELYGISRSSVRDIKTGRRWAKFKPSPWANLL